MKENFSHTPGFEPKASVLPMSYPDLYFKCNIVIHYFSQAYNAQQNQGAGLELNYQILFTTSTVPPKLSYFTFNGIPICSNGNVVTPSTTQGPSTIPPTGGNLN